MVHRIVASLFLLEAHKGDGRNKVELPPLETVGVIALNFIPAQTVVRREGVGQFSLVRDIEGK